MAYKRNDQNTDRDGAVTGFKDGQPVYKRGTRAGEGQNERTYKGNKPYRGKRDEGAGYTHAQHGEKPNGGGHADEQGTQRGQRPYRGGHADEQGAQRGEKTYRGGKTYGGRRDYGQEERPAEKKPYSREQAINAPADDARSRRPRRETRTIEPAREAEAVTQPLREDELPYILMGRNAVKEAVKSGRSIDRILVQSEPDGSLREIVGLARDRNVQVREVDRAKLDLMCMPFGHGNKTGNHQGIVAQVPGVQYCQIADILDVAAARGEKPFIVILDGIEDPYNLGSILRSAECAGAHGVIIPKRRASGVTSSACKASAGAVEYIKVAQVSNLTGAIGRLKDAGLWIVGADMRGEPMHKMDFSGAVGLVIGSEGKGISKLVKDNCDFLVSIPMFGKIDSLNASVAAAILLYEKARRKLD